MANDGNQMNVAGQGLAGRYASALFELARERREIDGVAASLAALESALMQTDDLKTLISSPLVDRGSAGAAMRAVAQRLGLNPLVGNTVGVMARAGRLFALPAVIRAFRTMVAASRGQTTAEVTAAHPLNAGQQAQLQQVLKARTGRDMALDIRVNPEILGGLVVKIGSEQIDSSLKTRLERLGQAMKG